MDMDGPVGRGPRRYAKFKLVRSNYGQRGWSDGTLPLGPQNFRRCPMRTGGRSAADSTLISMKIGRLARWYRWVEYAAFGRALERCRFANLTLLERAQRVLILGEGDGRTLARLLAVAPAARFEVIELSSEMIALAKARARD